MTYVDTFGPGVLMYVDADGDVDADDVSIVAEVLSGSAIAFDAPGPDEALDLNADRVIDASDLRLAETLAQRFALSQLSQLRRPGS